MGVGHLDIGIGEGAAQVFSPNPAIQMYGQILAKRQLKKEADNKFLNDQLAQAYDPSVLRNDADKQEYLKQYNTIKQNAINAENENDKTKKALAIAEVRQQLGNLSAFGEGSKKQGVLDRQLGLEFMKNADKYNDDAVDKYKSGLNLPWNHPEVINNPSQIERRVDPTKIEAAYKKHRDDVIAGSGAKDADYFEQGVEPFTGKKGAYLYPKRGIAMQGDGGALESTIHWASAHPDVKKFLSETYSDIKGNDEQSTLALRALKYMHDQGDQNGFYKIGERKFIESNASKDADAMRRHQQNRLFDINNPLPSQAALGEQTPTQTLIVGDPAKGVPGMAHGNPEAIKKALSLLPSDKYEKLDVNKIYSEDPNTGEQVFTFPRQGKVDDKALKTIAAAKAKYIANGNDKPGMFGFKKGVPWEQSDTYKKIVAANPTFKEEKPATVVKLNPNSPTYLADAANMIANQGGNLTRLNQVEGKKSGKGQLDQARIHQGNTSDKTYTVKGGSTTYSHSKLLKMGYTEDQINEAVKAGTLK